MSRNQRSPQTIHDPDPTRTIIEISARHQIEPFRQGDLDGLCGLYSAINGLRLARYAHAPISQAEARRLMVAGANYLDRQHLFVDAIDGGIDTAPWRRLVKQVAKNAASYPLRIEVQRPQFAGKPSIDDIFAWITESLAQGLPVLAELGHTLDHYSVIAAIGATRLHLFDSANCKFILRTSCGIGRGLHRMSPKALLRLKVRRRS